MVRITYIHQYFKTPAESGAVRSWYLATGLANAGYKVTVITGGKVNKIVQFDRFTVHYIADSYNHNKDIIGRIWAFIGFMCKAYWLAAKLPKPDLVYATSTPLTILIPALFLKWTQGIPFIFEVRDLWPEAPIALGFLKRPLVKYLAQKFAKTGYIEAEAVVALSPDMKNVIQYLVPKAQVQIYLI